jgi:hypothetical protein
VGPFAILARLATSEAWGEILGLSSSGLLDHEVWLMRELTAANLCLLSREELEHHVPLHIRGSDPADVRVYQAAFSDSDILPWDTETLRELGLID